MLQQFRPVIKEYSNPLIEPRLILFLGGGALSKEWLMRFSRLTDGDTVGAASQRLVTTL